MSEKWKKKGFSTKLRDGVDYSKKYFLIEVSILPAAFISDVYFMDYIEYRLNLDHGTDGLVVLDDISLINKEVLHEECNEA
ncbi:MAG: hypothetical protein [Microviridae sp.]|nr:MAG: hypothetical protein [Microviridae sp.]